MPDRAIAAKINKPREGTDGPFSIDLVPRREIEGLGEKAFSPKLKAGATQSQVECLQAQLNLLVVDASVKA